mgnify:CR=1 FL=1
MIQGLVQLFIFQALGELVSKFALPFIPGPVLGLVLLLVYLSVRGHVPASIDLVGGSILQHLGLLFIPASVGVVLYLPVLKVNAWAISAALVASVVPWIISDTSAAVIPARASTARTPSSTPSSGAAGVVSTLAVQRWPSCSRTTSVNVPPISTPIKIS